MSITEVNSMVDQGEVEMWENSHPLRHNPLFFELLMGTLGSTMDAMDVEAVELSNKTLTYRPPERHRRVWIVPFQDERGNIHEGSIVHTLTRPGYWQRGNNLFYPKSYKNKDAGQYRCNISQDFGRSSIALSSSIVC